jgi:PIN domain nuclease of toxin-antitoxin system
MPRHLADTHATLWFAADPRRLGPKARRLFAGLNGTTHEMLVSVVSLWEVAMLCDDGAIRLPAGFSAWCDALEEQVGVRVIPLLREDVEAARAFRDLKDPHDRLIAGTAARLGVPLVTRDQRMTAHRRVRTVW